MDPAGSSACQQILGQGQKQGHRLTAALPVVGYVLQIHEGGTAGLTDQVEKLVKVPLLQRVALLEDTLVILEEMIGPHGCPVAAGGPDSGQIFPESIKADVSQNLTAKAGGHLPHLLGEDVYKRQEVDHRSEKIGKKIREAQLEKVPYMLVVGDRDMENGTVSPRHRADGDLGAMSLDAFAAMLKDVVDTKAIN